mmetsp:Transcript_24140/g.23198  ORF Transcript_24140/g.23198 Transcript_24140/m.23198 type:complete len:103 (-) Transcript_24140:60-368(-)
MRSKEKLVLKYNGIQELSTDADSYPRHDAGIAHHSFTDYDASMSAAEIKAIADEKKFSDFQEIPDSPEKPDETQNILNNFGFIGIQAPKGACQLAAEAAVVH